MVVDDSSSAPPWPSSSLRHWFPPGRIHRPALVRWGGRIRATLFKPQLRPPPPPTLRLVCTTTPCRSRFSRLKSNFVHLKNRNVEIHIYISITRSALSILLMFRFDSIENSLRNIYTSQVLVPGKMGGKIMDGGEEKESSSEMLGSVIRTEMLTSRRWRRARGRVISPSSQCASHLITSATRL